MFNGLKESNPLLILAGIVLIPIGVAVVSLWVDTRIDERQRKAAEDLFQRQQALTVAQTMDSYFQGVGMLLTETPDQPESTGLVVARTNALLNRLGRAEDRALIVHFVAELSPGLTARPERMLERASKPFIDLADLDFSGTDLSYVNLYQANLRGADLSGTNLLWANLAGANLRGARLDAADLRGATLSGADLSGASLRGAKIGGSDFSSANLRDADLSEADRTVFEFEGLSTETNLSNTNLSGALWFDGARCSEFALEKCGE